MENINTLSMDRILTLNDGLKKWGSDSDVTKVDKTKKDKTKLTKKNPVKNWKDTFTRR